MAHEDTHEDWERIEQVLDAVLDAPAEQRQVTLDRLTRDTPDIRARVEQLLRADADAGSFMRGAVSGGVSGDRPPAAMPTLQAGDRVGPWGIERVLGRGGMGEVYLASRADGQFSQQVALKLLSPAADAQAERFMRERQILADLDHPGLARLVDGGVTDAGQPFMAMEYVEGDTLLDYCQRHALPLEARLRLFLKVCDVVAYAHQRLVIHRDIKPANVMVRADGTVKLLDFGIATLAREVVEDGELTQALVTPNYAAPEQLAGRGVTTATDVHGLGATLFALLTGGPPWQLSNASLPVAIDRVLNAPAPQPSASLVPGALPGVDPARLRGDLDAICAKALRKDPDARYESAAALAADVRNVLDHQPVSARQGSRWYTAQRYIRRHRLAVAASAIVAVLLLTALGATTWMAQRAANERDMARRDAARLSSMRNSVLHLFQAATDTEDRSQLTATELLDTSAEQIEKDFADDPANAAALLQMFGQIYYSMDDELRATPLLERVIALESEGAHPDVVADARYILANLALASGDAEQSRALFDVTLAHWNSAPGKYRAERVWSATLESKLLRLNDDPAGAVAALERAADGARDLWGDTHYETGIVLNNLATAHYFNGDLPRSLEIFSQVWDVWVATDRAQTPDALGTLSNWGAVAMRWGQPEVARARLEQALSVREALYGESAALAPILSNMANLALLSGDHAQSIAHMTRGAELAERFSGAGSQIHSILACGRARVLAIAGQSDAAEAQARAILDNLQGRTADLQPASDCSVALGLVAIGRGEHTDALAHFARGEADLREAGVSGQVTLIQLLRHRAGLQLTLGRLDRAQADYKEALALRRASRHDNHYEVRAIEAELARVVARRGDEQTARQMARTAAVALAESLGPDHPESAKAQRIADSL